MLQDAIAYLSQSSSQGTASTLFLSLGQQEQCMARSQEAWVQVLLPLPGGLSQVTSLSETITSPVKLAEFNQLFP